MSSKPAILCLTFDNFGEAFDLQNGLHPNGRAIGKHRSVQILPAILDTLSKAQARATFFIEGWNADRYPRQLHQLVTNGHEVGVHGWMHEIWQNQKPAQQITIIEQCRQAFAKLAIYPKGLRPPGGAVTAQTAEMLASRGFTYTSALGHRPRIADGFAELPFEWEHVDALYFEPLLANGRDRLFGTRATTDVGVWERALSDLLEELAENGGLRSVIFHPYLLAEDAARMAAFQDFVDAISAAPNVEVVPSHLVAYGALTDRDFRAQFFAPPIPATELAPQTAF